MYRHHIERPVASTLCENVFLAKVKLSQVLDGGQQSSCRTHSLSPSVITTHWFLLVEMTINIQWIFFLLSVGELRTEHSAHSAEFFFAANVSADHWYVHICRILRWSEIDPKWSLKTHVEMPFVIGSPKTHVSTLYFILMQRSEDTLCLEFASHFFFNNWQFLWCLVSSLYGMLQHPQHHYYVCRDQRISAFFHLI